jgi:hypothetical protein
MSGQPSYQQRCAQAKHARSYCNPTPTEEKYNIDIVRFKKEYPTTPNKVFQSRYRISKSVVSNLAHKHHLKKAPEYINPGGFKKGSNPWNAGRVGVCHPGSVKTHFPKGHLPSNTLFDGAITIRNERDFKTGHKRKTLMIRVRVASWEYLQRKIWADANGPIPPKHCVRFIDGDPMHCDLSNLELISMAENARRNHNYKKSGISLKAYWEEGTSDKHIASYIVGANIKLQQYLINKRPDIIEAKRAQLLLNRNIKNHGCKTETQKSA